MEQNQLMNAITTTAVIRRHIFSAETAGGEWGGVTSTCKMAPLHKKRSYTGCSEFLTTKGGYVTFHLDFLLFRMLFQVMRYPFLFL